MRQDSTKSNKNLILSIVIIVCVIGLGLGIYALLAVSKITDNVLPDKPVHWHPNLKIIIEGKEVGIPANIGIGGKYANSPFYDSMMGMTGMHTHDDSGTLHWEVMMHAPTPQDMYLGNFFQVWGKTFNENCIFEFCNGRDGKVKMSVNGRLNNEFERYSVRDGDKIEITFE